MPLGDGIAGVCPVASGVQGVGNAVAAVGVDCGEGVVVGLFVAMVVALSPVAVAVAVGVISWGGHGTGTRATNTCWRFDGLSPRLAVAAQRG